MNESRLMQQVTAIFSTFMVFFYVGIGIFFIWYADRSTIDKAVRVILGSTFLFYGIYRAFRSFEKIREAFFTKYDDSDRENNNRNGRIGR
ncbi:MAG TPA: hypothetical protein VHO46_09075 [Bacteroidales bacterium]|nr:hypothetical protein [Bacteroidales bacterium]